MKKRLLLLCCLVFILAGCAKPAPEYDPSQWLSADIHSGAISSEGYYHLRSTFLYFTDLSNGVSVCLCSRVGCLHDKEEDPQLEDQCEAYVSGAPATTPMWFWNGQLYYLDGYENSTLYSRNAAGVDLQEVMRLGENYIREQWSVGVKCYVHIGDKVYYQAQVTDSGLENQDREDFSYIGQIDLKDHSDKVLIESIDLLLYAANSEGFLFSQGENRPIDYEDPNYVEDYKGRQVDIKYWNTKTGEATTLHSTTNREFGGIYALNDDRVIYFRNTDSRYMVYDRKTGESREIANGLRVINDRYALQENEDGYVLYDFKTSEQLPVTVDTDALSIDKVVQDAVILVAREKEPGGTRYIKKTYYYVKLASLFDGLQEKDMTAVYTVDLLNY